MFGKGNYVLWPCFGCQVLPPNVYTIYVSGDIQVMPGIFLGKVASLHINLYIPALLKHRQGIELYTY